MQIDWFTLIAQIVNFLILLALLKYFLYDRVIAAMDKRRQDIADKIDDAKKTKSAAEDELEEYRKKQQELEKRKQEILNEAKEQAEEKKKEMIRDARDEVDEQRDKWQQSLKKEQEDFLANLKDQIGRQSYTILRRILADLADAELEHSVVKSFLKRVDELSDEELAEFAESARDSEDGISVTTAFALNEDQTQSVKDSMHDHFGEKIDVTFKESDEILAGIRIDAGGRRLEWSINDYLDDFEEHFVNQLQKQTDRQKNGAGDEDSSEDSKNEKKQSKSAS